MKLLKKKKTVDLNLFNYYFKYPIPTGMYKKLNETDTENNKVKVNLTKDDMTNF